ncbi:PadR family transcriptional regulator [Leifsonia sp. McL0607]|uniref:PadR family transcriptional regulator n=1 Tax=Leifsonia sp. McL0607 TaxID=3415672 RepID=UPI003CF3BCE4
MRITPLRQPSFYILAALARDRLHGYAIIKDAEAATEGRVTIQVGTLYAALDRLASEGLVRADGDDVVDGRPRRYFALTDAGRIALRAEAERMAAGVALVRRRLDGVIA